MSLLRTERQEVVTCPGRHVDVELEVEVAEVGAQPNEGLLACFQHVLVAPVANFWLTAQQQQKQQGKSTCSPITITIRAGNRREVFELCSRHGRHGGRRETA